VPTRDDNFGIALASLDAGRSHHDDLAIGIPGKRPQARGGVAVLYGSRGGLTASGDELWTRDSPGVTGGSEPWDLFGSALAPQG